MYEETKHGKKEESSKDERKQRTFSEKNLVKKVIGERQPIQGTNLTRG